MRYSWLLLLLFLVFLFSDLNAQPTLDTAKTYVGVKELTGHNDGPEVEKFLRSVKLPKGTAWCAAFVSYCLYQSKAIAPKKYARTGLARDFATKVDGTKVVSSEEVLRGTITIPKGSILVYEKQNTIFGHTGFVLEDWKGKTGKTIEGNTSSGVSGSQSDGNGVYIRTRSINPANYFRLRYFTYVVEDTVTKYIPIVVEPKSIVVEPIPMTTIETIKKYFIKYLY